MACVPSARVPNYLLEERVSQPPEALQQHAYAALEQLQQAAHALQLATAAAHLLALPDELLLRCLVTASLADLAAAARTCRGLRDAAHTGCLWLRHCSRRFWRESRGVEVFGSGPIAASPPP